jgi:hypothetical protein
VFLKNLIVLTLYFDQIIDICSKMSVKFDGLDEKSQILIKLAISASNEPILKILDIIPMFFGVRNSMDTLSKPKNCLKIPQIRFIAILEP